MASVDSQGKDPAPASADNPRTDPNSIISAYLSEHIPEYRDLVGLRKEVNTLKLISSTLYLT